MGFFLIYCAIGSEDDVERPVGGKRQKERGRGEGEIGRFPAQGIDQPSSEIRLAD
ncbi:hypothetical protein K0M31_006157 [Melipona bicolor]|uniref:Uncharacterized protein n=1 Tax=Melipona bicolor TaxID=60889 RepID=A0AA40KLG9_9HYME|nr:hypothetical protein K0M31_006157 [Melipona bicolor]